MAGNRFVSSILRTAQVTTVSLPWARAAKIINADDVPCPAPQHADKMDSTNIAAQ